MNQQNNISPGVFVFSKWSRKAYAVFASLGKQIKIGVLKAEICQKALLKGLVDLSQIVKLEADFDEDETALDTSVHDAMQFLLSSLGLSVFLTSKLITQTISKKDNPLRIKLLKNLKSAFYLV